MGERQPAKSMGCELVLDAVKGKQADKGNRGYHVGAGPQLHPA